MALIALIILLMTSGCMRCGNVGALQGILIAAWASADDAGRGIRRNIRRRFHNSGRRRGGSAALCVGIHAIEIVEIAVTAV